MVPSIWVPVLRRIYHRAFRTQIHLRCWWNDRSTLLAKGPEPLPPAMLRFRVSESLSKEDFLSIGQGCASLLEQSLANTNVSLDQAQRVLDFGCGCGRTIRWLIPRYPNVAFHGVDVDRQAIQWCQTELSRGNFLANGANPPLPYPDNHFDVIYSVSVFTHLSESMQDAWLAELKRLLKPSGVLVLTIYAADTTSAALDAGAIDELRTKGFLHRRSTKLKASFRTGTTRRGTPANTSSAVSRNHFRTFAAIPCPADCKTLSLLNDRLLRI